MHFANYLVLGLLIACILGAAAVILSWRNSWWFCYSGSPIP